MKIHNGRVGAGSGNKRIIIGNETPEFVIFVCIGHHLKSFLKSLGKFFGLQKKFRKERRKTKKYVKIFAKENNVFVNPFCELIV